MLNLLRKLKYLSNNLIKVSFSDKFLLTTNCLISVSLSSVGDIIEQNLEIYRKEIEKYDIIRSRNMAASGLTVGVFCHFWYKVLDNRLPGRTFKIVVKKVLVDQMIASPIVISLFFVTLGLMKRESMNETMIEIREKFLRLYKAEWVVWPTAQVVNFWILPLKYRVLYDNTISLGYDVYTSMVINEPIQHKESPQMTIINKDHNQLMQSSS
ncbi:mpv17-like protein 2 [Chironomus tepperi]|uniref:mpv17-like protein 2 n=1 Tax=Chironomus tepperi TaxID=113505 RepID=UPI00391F83E1